MVSHRIDHHAVVVGQLYQEVKAVEEMTLIAQLIVYVQLLVIQVLTYLGQMVTIVTLSIQNHAFVFIYGQQQLLWPALVKNANFDHIV